MSILIKGMEMPKTHPLTITIYPDGQVLSETVGSKDIHGEAVPVPPHGRLIDADAMCDLLTRLADNEYSLSVFASWIKNHDEVFPTIIPAEEGE